MEQDIDMILPSKVKFVDKKIELSFNNLKDSNIETERKLYEFLNRAFKDIEKNAFCGVQIPKRLIPKEYFRYNIHNLWKYDLPNSWRLLYAIESEEILVISILLEWMDHKEYERKFNY